MTYVETRGREPVAVQRSLTVCVRGVHWSAGGRAILKGISLDVRPGEFLGLVGPNGSGKTSLLRCIYRRYRPRLGTVLIGDRNVWELSAREAARRVAVILQHSSAKLGLSVREVVLLGRLPFKGIFARDTEADHEIAEAALARLGLSALAERAFDNLSGGEEQQVMFARAIVQQAGVLILDEPTNHLDIRHQFEAMHLVRRLEATAIAAIHDLNLAATYCDRLAVLNAGEVVAYGSPGEVLRPSLIKEVFGVEADVDKHPRTHALRITVDPQTIET